MRIAHAALVGAIAVSAGVPAAYAQQKYDPYPWCAEYGAGRGGDVGTNCYFMTLEQCRWAISGNGGFCRENRFYTGPAPTGREARRAR